MNSGVIIIFSNGEQEISKSNLKDLMKIKTNKLCIVNNGSTDNTLSFLNDIKFNSAKNISVLDIKNNKGINTAIKAGARSLLSESEFDFIVYLQSNMLDYLEDLKRYLKSLKKNKEGYISLPTRSNRNVLKNVFSLEELLLSTAS
jgi:glycosyltransferase involved in cell wall biosynthesis